MTRNILWMVALILITQASHASEKEIETLTTFEMICLNTLNKPSRVSDILDSISATRIPQKQERAILYPQKGKAWFVKGKNANFIVHQTDQMVCGISQPYINAQKVEKILLNTIKSRKIYSSDEGTQVVSMYAITQPDKFGDKETNGHGILAINKSKLGNGLTMTIAPEDVAKSQGISTPSWP